MNGFAIATLVVAMVFGVLSLIPAKEWIRYWLPGFWPKDSDAESTSTYQFQPSRDEVNALWRQVGDWKLAVDQKYITGSRLREVVGQDNTRLGAMKAAVTGPSSNGQLVLVDKTELGRLVNEHEEIQRLLVLVDERQQWTVSAYAPQHTVQICFFWVTTAPSPNTSFF